MKSFWIVFNLKQGENHPDKVRIIRIKTVFEFRVNHES